MGDEAKLEAAMDLMRRMPPRDVVRCPETKKDFLCCDYNRDGDSFRSPFTGNYIPPQPEGTQPSAPLRQLELAANEIFQSYTQAYFDQGLSSVFFWDLEEGFAGAIMIKKEVGDSCWDSIHVVEVQPKEGGAKGTFSYHLTSTVMLWLSKNADGTEFNLAGTVTRDMKTEGKASAPTAHIPNIGSAVQDMENKLRGALDQVYFGATSRCTTSLRSMAPRGQSAAAASLAGVLQGSLRR